MVGDGGMGAAPPPLLEILSGGTVLTVILIFDCIDRLKNGLDSFSLLVNQTCII